MRRLPTALQFITHTIVYLMSLLSSAASPTTTASTSHVSVKVPTYDSDSDPESFNVFVDQFDRYCRISRIDESIKLDLFLLSAGNKVAKLYAEISWPSLTSEEAASGVTEFSRAVKFFKSRILKDRNCLSERIQLYRARRSPEQSLLDFVSELRQIASYCDFPQSYSDEAIRDAFAQGLLSETTRQSVCRAFSNATSSGLKFSLSDAITAAEIEEQTVQLTAQGGSTSHHSSLTVSAAAKSYKDPKRQKIRAATQPVRPGCRCYWCGKPEKHGKDNCPARNVQCFNCNLVGHFSKVCRRNLKAEKSSGSHVAANCIGLSSITALSNSSPTQRKYLTVQVGQKPVVMLVDPGAEISVLSRSVCRRIGLSFRSVRFRAHDASGRKSIPIVGKTTRVVEVGGKLFPTTIYIAERLGDDGILGATALKEFRSVKINYGGNQGDLVISPLEKAKLAPSVSEFRSRALVGFSNERVSTVAAKHPVRRSNSDEPQPATAPANGTVRRNAAPATTKITPNAGLLQRGDVCTAGAEAEAADRDNARDVPLKTRSGRTVKKLKRLGFDE